MTPLLEWLARESHLLLQWWLWTALAGLAALPLCLGLLGGLPDRGYGLARALGAMLVTLVFWLLGSGGFLDNSRGSIALAWILLALISLAAYSRARREGEWRSWWRENRAHVAVCELLFATLFLAWALYRAHQNSLLGTEKPMELAFLSAVQRSPGFPPADPWMSGYAISYYYFGYVMSAALSTLSGISSTVGFNLTNAWLFALTGLTTYGVAYNLARSRAFEAFGRFAGRGASRRAASATGLLAMTLLLLMGNFQMLLIEAPYQTRSASPQYLDSWGAQARSGFGESEYAQDESASYALHSAKWGHWWWFRASRVLTDYDLSGNATGTQPIDEFPAFSFILSDNHPHVLALPFVAMVLGMMLNLLLNKRAPTSGETLLYGSAIGGLAFLNAWDAPIYWLGMVGAEALRRLMTSERGRLSAADWLAQAKFGLWLAGIAVVACLPFLVSFRSQAGGLLPNLLNPTYFPRFFVMFGPFVLILGSYLVAEAWRGRRLRRWNWRLGLGAATLLLLALSTLTCALALVLASGNYGNPVIGNPPNPAAEGGSLLAQLVQRRLDHAATTIILLFSIALVVARLFPSARQAALDGDVAVRWIKYPGATGFALLLTGMGLSLALIPEFVYLRDNFGVRINTIFKFYYQAWVLWSIAGAYALFSLLAERGQPRPHLLLRLVLGFGAGLCLLAGLAYTVEGVHHRAWIESGRQSASSWRRYAPPADWERAIRRVAQGSAVEAGVVLFSNGELENAPEKNLLRAGESGIAMFDGEAVIIYAPLTLDGASGLLHADDQRAIACLSELTGRADTVVAEAVGDPYRIEYGRVGTLAGIPIVLGWENHERQWRGPTYDEIAGERAADIRRLYTASDMEAAQAIIDRYQLDYILYGASELEKYGGQGEEKFLDNLSVVCQAGQSRVYASGRRG